MAAVVDDIKKSRVKRFTITYTDSTGAPISLVGYSLRMDLKTSITGSTIVSVDNGGNGGITVSSNVASFEISSAKTALLPLGTIYTDVKATPPGPGEPFTLAEFIFNVTQVYTL